MQALLLLMVQYEAALQKASGSVDFKQELPQITAVCDSNASQTSAIDA